MWSLSRGSRAINKALLQHPGSSCTRTVSGTGRGGEQGEPDHSHPLPSHLPLPAPSTLGSVPGFSQPDFTGQQPLITRACPHPSHQMILRFMKISLSTTPQLGSRAGTGPLQLLPCSALASNTTGPQACRQPGQELGQPFRVGRWHCRGRAEAAFCSTLTPSQRQLSCSRCCAAGTGVMVRVGRWQLPGLPRHLQLWGTSTQPWRGACPLPSGAWGRHLPAALEQLRSGQGCRQLPPAQSRHSSAG